MRFQLDKGTLARKQAIIDLKEEVSNLDASNAQNEETP